MLCKFELGHNAAETTKNICCAKGEGTVDHSTVTRFCWGFCKNLNDQLMSDRAKTINSEVVLISKLES